MGTSTGGILARQIRVSSTLGHGGRLHARATITARLDFPEDSEPRTFPIRREESCREFRFSSHGAAEAIEDRPPDHLCDVHRQAVAEALGYLEGRFENLVAGRNLQRPGLDRELSAGEVQLFFVPRLCRRFRENPVDRVGDHEVDFEMMRQIELAEGEATRGVGLDHQGDVEAVAGAVEAVGEVAVELRGKGPVRCVLAHLAGVPPPLFGARRFVSLPNSEHYKNIYNTNELG